MTGTVGYTGSLKTIIDGKAPLASPAFTGAPTIGGTAVAKTSDITAAVNGLVNAAPGTLDTLGELAAALTADEGTAATLATLVGTKAPLASPALTGSPTINGTAVAKVTDIPAGYSDEQAQDAAAALFTAGTMSGITFTYDDAGNRINATVTPGAVADATTTSKGAVQLAGDLAGTAAAPTLATIGSATGPTGSGTAVAQVTIDAKGRVTALTPVTNIDANASGTANNPVTNAAATRPTGLTKVFWQCPTQPTNWLTGDEWINNS